MTGVPWLAEAADRRDTQLRDSARRSRGTKHAFSSRMPRFAWTIAALLIVSGARRAAAQEPSERTWYGWQVIAADAAVVGLVMLDTRTISFLGFDGPLIHWANGQTQQAAISLVARVGGLGLGLLGGIIVGATIDEDPLISGGIGAGIRLGAALLVDYTVISWKDTPRHEPAPGLRGVGFAPHAGGGVVRLTGTW